MEGLIVLIIEGTLLRRISVGCFGCLSPVQGAAPESETGNADIGMTNIIRMFAFLVLPPATSGALN